jgi:ABC-type multidrug transport system fused ATPase/permease subunit
MIWIAGKFAKYRSQTAAATDQRVRYVSELIDGIATVKSYGWETPFFLMIRKLRATETQNIAASQFLKAVNQGIMFSIPTVAAFATFAVYWGNGGILSIPKVFATLSLLQVLRMTIGAYWLKSIERGSESIASCHRIEAFLSLAVERPSVSVTSPTENISSSSDIKPPLICLGPGASYYHGSDPFNPVLREVHLSVSRGEVLIIVGPVGCGKSSLLSAVLSEISVMSQGGVGFETKQQRVISPQTTIAYCAQKPWILASSVKANIALAGSVDRGEENFKRPQHIDSALYTLAVESTLIVDDLIQWPAYDDTEVGEKGISISGGQKARISLARAVYSNADCKFTLLLSLFLL